jgi:hypothetical protein
VIVQITVTKGDQYVTSIDQSTLNFGDIAPGSSKTISVTLTLSDSWLAAPAGEEIKIQAIVTQETSRPDHTVGKQDTGTTTHPGNCPP